MASLSQILPHLKNFEVQKTLSLLFADFVITKPVALTAANPAAITSADPAAVAAVAPPAGGTGAAAGAYDTAANRDAMITSLTTLRTDLIATRAEVVKDRADLAAARTQVVNLVADITALRLTVNSLTNVTA